MGELTVNRTAEQIAVEINSIKEETKRVVIYNIIEIGRKLTEAKELVPAGQWGNWLKNSVDYKKSTANNLMRIFKEYGADQLTLLGANTKNEIYNKLDYSKAVVLLGTSEEEKEEIIKNNDVENMSSRELKALKEKLKRTEEEKAGLEKTLAESQEQLNKVNASAEKIASEANEKEFSQNKTIEELRDKLKKSKVDAETIKELEGEVVKLKHEKEELENKPVEVTGVSEKEKALEEEVIRLKEEKEGLKQQVEAQAVVDVDDATIRYATYFSIVVDNFDKLIGSLKEIKLDEEREQYKEATKQLLSMMEEKVQ